jgi:hypothetical protein
MRNETGARMTSKLVKVTIGEEEIHKIQYNSDYICVEVFVHLSEDML